MNERIKKLRKALDITQQEFADRINVKRNTVATYELGRSEPSNSAIALICREFNVSETWLRTGEGEMFIEVDADKELATLFAKFAQSTIVKNDPFTKTILIEIMKFMVEATEEEWIPIKKFIKKLANTIE